MSNRKIVKPDRDRLKRLAEYEDTGITPAEAVAIRNKLQQVYTALGIETCPRMDAFKEIEEKLGDMVEIIKPLPDSQYRLLPCECGSTNVAYVRYGYYQFHTVLCGTCKKETALHRVKHAAQIEWNGKELPSWERD